MSLLFPLVRLKTGWLVTVANVGDSAVLIDTHTEVKELTSCHRLDDNELEVARLRKGVLPVQSICFPASERRACARLPVLSSISQIMCGNGGNVLGSAVNWLLCGGAQLVTLWQLCARI
jgi:hypothetical protein